jgi:hypothetical protein
MAVRSSGKQPGRIRIITSNNIFQTNIGTVILAEE